MQTDVEMLKHEKNQNEEENRELLPANEEIDQSPPAKKLKQSRLPFSQIVQLPQVSSNSQKAPKRKFAVTESLKKFKCDSDSSDKNNENEVAKEEEVSSSTEEIGDENKSEVVELVESEDEIPQDCVSTSKSGNSLCNESLDEGEKSEESFVDEDLDKSLSKKSLDTSTSEKEEDLNLSLTKTTVKKKLTPEERAEKILLKKKKAEEREASRLEKEKAKELLRQKKEMEKIEREKKKLELQQRKEEKRLKKEEEKQKREEEKQKKEEEKQKKEEEKQQKIEMKQKKLQLIEAKQEEKRQKKLEKSFREEKEQEKSNKLKAAFEKFFVKKDVTTQQELVLPESSFFKAFEVKINMKLAPITRFDLAKREDQVKCLDDLISNQLTSKLYLEEIQSKCRTIGKSKRTWQENENDVDDDIELIENDDKKSARAKFFKFHENVRPPYYGTWRKNSRIISPRNPFKKDAAYFDYEVDSDDEWEEEEPGESLSGTEDEKESEDEYEVDNEFFVPHGYLSQDEDDDEEKEKMTLDSQMSKIKLKEMEFERERKEKFEKIKPKILGPIWIDNNKQNFEELFDFLRPFQAMILNDILPMEISSPEPSPTDKNNDTPSSTTKIRNSKKSFPEDAMPYLIRLLHRNHKKRLYLVNEFLQFWQQLKEKEENNELKPENSPGTTPTSKVQRVSKNNLKMTMKNIATREKCCDKNSNKTVFTWMVKEEYLNKYSLEDIPHPWEYVTLEKEEKTESEPQINPESPLVNSTPKNKMSLDKFLVKVKSISPSEQKKKNDEPEQSGHKNETEVEKKEVIEITLDD